MFGVRKNPKIRPQIRTFGQGLPCDFQKKAIICISTMFAPQSILQVEIGSLDYENDTTNIM